MRSEDHFVDGPEGGQNETGDEEKLHAELEVARRGGFRLIGHRDLLLNCAAGWVARTVRGIRRQSGSEGGGGGAADGGGCGGGREAGGTETGRGVAAGARRSRRGGRGGGQGGGGLGWFGLEVAEALGGGREFVFDRGLMGADGVRGGGNGTGVGEEGGGGRSGQEEENQQEGSAEGAGALRCPKGVHSAPV